MRNKSSRITLLALIVVALMVIGIGASPKPALAQHPLLDVGFEMSWGFVNPHDPGLWVWLTDSNGVVLGGQEAQLLSIDQWFMWWHVQMTNVPDEAVGFIITWDSEPGEYWTPSSPTTGVIDWENEEIAGGDPFNGTFASVIYDMRR